MDIRKLEHNKMIVRASKINLMSFTKNLSSYFKEETNNKNTAFGTTINSSTYLKLYYQRDYLIDHIGVTGGLTFVHASNSNIKSPNSGVNIWALTVGLNYNLTPKEPSITFIPSSETEKVQQQ